MNLRRKRPFRIMLDWSWGFFSGVNGPSDNSGVEQASQGRQTQPLNYCNNWLILVPGDCIYRARREPPHSPRPLWVVSCWSQRRPRRFNGHRFVDSTSAPESMLIRIETGSSVPVMMMRFSRWSSTYGGVGGRGEGCWGRLSLKEGAPETTCPFLLQDR